MQERGVLADPIFLDSTPITASMFRPNHFFLRIKAI